MTDLRDRLTSAAAPGAPAPGGPGTDAAQKPPRFVPTLTEVVRVRQTTAPTAMALSVGDTAKPAEAQTAAGIDEQVHKRFRQELDMVLEARLRTVVANVVSEHVTRMLPVLQNEVEQQVMDAVRSALNVATTASTANTRNE